MSKDYEGSLLDDCASIVEAGKRLEAMRAMPASENIFDRARRLNTCTKKHCTYGSPHSVGRLCDCNCPVVHDPFGTGDSPSERECQHDVCITDGGQ